MSVLQAKAIDESAVRAVSARTSEPEWALRQRLDALQKYNSMSLPAANEEAWRRTNLSAVDLDSVVPFVDAPGDSAQLAEVHVSPNAAAVIVQHNGHTVLREVDPALAAMGVICTDLQTAMRDHADLVRRHLYQTVAVDENKFTALHAALLQGGLFLYLPRGAAVDRPIRLLVSYDAPGLGGFTHTLIVAEANSAVTVLEQYTSSPASPGTAAALHAGAVEIVAGPGSRVRHATLQTWSAQQQSFTVRRARVERDAGVDWVAGELGGDLVRVEQRSELVASGAGSRSVAAFFASGEQHLDIGAAAVHQAPHTASDILVRGVLSGRARSIFRGLGHIIKGARGAEMSQSARTLLLDDTARADAIPSLLIDDNDVKAGHAATTGPIDPAQLFYLQSRGIPRQEAVRMIVSGFFAPLLEQIAVPGLRDELQHLILQKMGA